MLIIMLLCTNVITPTQVHRHFVYADTQPSAFFFVERQKQCAILLTRADTECTKKSSLSEFFSLFVQHDLFLMIRSKRFVTYTSGKQA
jgi:hypothetical protein